MTYHRPQPAPRTEQGRHLVTRAVLCHLTKHAARTVRDRATPVACDLDSRRVLYDLDEFEQAMTGARLSPRSARHLRDDSESATIGAVAHV